MLRFGLFGIPVTVHWFFWIVVALLSGQLTSSDPGMLSRLTAWMAAVFISILWHELGHGVAFRQFGGAPRILLYGFGGLCSAEGYFRRNQHIIISLAGPAAGLLLGITIFLLVRSGIVSLRSMPGDFLKHFVWSMLWVNIFWSLVNLLPVCPLDGGRVLEHLLGPGQLRTTLMVSIVTAALLGVGALLFLNSLFMGVLFLYLAFINYQRLQGVRQSYTPF